MRVSVAVDSLADTVYDDTCSAILSMRRGKVTRVIPKADSDTLVVNGGGVVVGLTFGRGAASSPLPHWPRRQGADAAAVARGRGVCTTCAGSRGSTAGSDAECRARACLRRPRTRRSRRNRGQTRGARAAHAQSTASAHSRRASGARSRYPQAHRCWLAPRAPREQRVEEAEATRRGECGTSPLMMSA